MMRFQQSRTHERLGPRLSFLLKKLHSYSIQQRG